jgi:hypothetical protein
MKNNQKQFYFLFDVFLPTPFAFTRMKELNYKPHFIESIYNSRRPSNSHLINIKTPFADGFLEKLRACVLPAAAQEPRRAKSDAACVCGEHTLRSNSNPFHART